jgi:type III pantothenate kinase
MQTSLDEPGSVGQDRLLDALGAFSRSNQACVVIDAGTAVTVDFVDGQGVFHGGAIAAGLAMMLDALHERTSRLPIVKVTPELLAGPRLKTAAVPGAGPSSPAEEPLDTDEQTVPLIPEPFGKTTSQAMAIGAAAAVQGLVHILVDRYAEFYGAYPRVVATGGDAPLLFEQDPLVEVIVPDLTLIGMFAALRTIEDLDQAADSAQSAGD